MLLWTRGIFRKQNLHVSRSVSLPFTLRDMEFFVLSAFPHEMDRFECVADLEP